MLTRGSMKDMMDIRSDNKVREIIGYNFLAHFWGKSTPEMSWWKENKT